MSYAAMQMAARSKARSTDWGEPALHIPLSEEMRELLFHRSIRPLSRPEIAKLRDLLSLALDRAVGVRK